MNIDNIIQQIKNIGAVPIPCKTPVKDGHIEFAGTLEEFLAFVAEHCHKTVAVWRLVFEEFAFGFKAERHSASDDETIDSRDLNPELSRFEQYLDTEFSYHLLAWMKDTDIWIEFTEWDSWFDEFSEEKGAAEGAYRATQKDVIIQRQQEREERQNLEKELLPKVAALIDDPVFCALRLQREMYAYACKKIDGLDKVRKPHVLDAIKPIWDKLGKNRNLK